jgi:hypothetical protein
MNRRSTHRCGAAAAHKSLAWFGLVSVVCLASRPEVCLRWSFAASQARGKRREGGTVQYCCSKRGEPNRRLFNPLHILHLQLTSIACSSEHSVRSPLLFGSWGAAGLLAGLLKGAQRQRRMAACTCSYSFHPRLSRDNKDMALAMTNRPPRSRRLIDRKCHCLPAHQ